jgi:hypothetical protein
MLEAIVVMRVPGMTVDLKVRFLPGAGDNSAGQCNVPPPNADFIAVGGGGYYHGLGLKSDGTVVAATRSERRASLVRVSAER